MAVLVMHSIKLDADILAAGSLRGDPELSC